MKGISITRQPSSRSAEERAPACFFARETRMRHPARGKTRREMFVRGLFAKVGVLRLGRRKTSAASAQDDTMTALVRLTTDDWQLATASYGCCATAAAAPYTSSRILVAPRRSSVSPTFSPSVTGSLPLCEKVGGSEEHTSEL